MNSPFIDITELFLGVSSFLYLISGWLLWNNANSFFKVANRILGVFFIVIAYNSLTYVLLTSGYIRYVPFLYKVAFPLNYIPYPLAYLYVRVTLRNQLNLKKSDLLHFLPFLISLIDYLPFYLLPIAEKKVIVANFLTHYSDSYLKNYGFIPSDYHFLARGVLGGIYCVLMFRLIRNRKEILPNNKLNYYFPKQINEVTNWLRTLTLGMVFIYMSYFISVVFIEIDGGFDKLITPIGITLLITSLTILSLAIQIFLHPNVLYGIPEIAIEDEVSIEKTNKELNKIKSTESESGFDWINFESKLKLEAPFTRAGITLNEMASLYNLSPRNLSFLVKNYTGFGFQDYLNKLRIDYVLLMLKENKHQEQTLESLGSEAGFGSKSAFFYSFKKNMGCTPKEYLQKESI